jgi:hypothetical protein
MMGAQRWHSMAATSSACRLTLAEAGKARVRARVGGVHAGGAGRGAAVRAVEYESLCSRRSGSACRRRMQGA